MSVILIGMPASGKSTLGVLLAKKLGLRFIDSDLLIQETEGKLLHDIIEERGIDGFLEVENRVNASITDTAAIISTGGSAVYCAEAMEHLRTLGKVVYLKISLETMLSRLGDYVHRGVVLPDGYTLEDMYKYFGDREIALCRELTKLHEEIIRTTLSEAIKKYTETAPKGEFVLVIKGYKGEDEATDKPEPLEMVKQLMAEGKSLKDAVKETSKALSYPKNHLYDAALEMISKEEE